MKRPSTTAVMDKPITQADTRTTGLACPKCGCRHPPVVYTRPRGDGILRARECRHCGRRFMTRERI